MFLQVLSAWMYLKIGIWALYHIGGRGKGRGREREKEGEGERAEEERERERFYLSQHWHCRYRDFIT